MLPLADRLNRSLQLDALSIDEEICGQLENRLSALTKSFPTLHAANSVVASSIFYLVSLLRGREQTVGMRMMELHLKGGYKNNLLVYTLTALVLKILEDCSASLYKLLDLMNTLSFILFIWTGKYCCSFWFDILCRNPNLLTNIMGLDLIGSSSSNFVHDHEYVMRTLIWNQLFVQHIYI